ncbi:hypothetical protein P280DRAFT_74120 [Massarina eburnea CBS 473.64]|uniref:PH domain-containing protein n=1 Tax=Massarina eburnea CBS 473.64 TaxID=1395130 RepID=A0A6A6RV25_9PLEO|nr:hypothetical protein P280DRAFT_74120 [Massarina eburnea CBS 473.64]
MATANPPHGAYAVEDHHGSDPFLTTPLDVHRQRYSPFDNSQFSLYLDGSPAQAKRALQAHLTETTRRLQEASHLGNALVQQRKELEEKLEEVDKQETDADIGPELRSRLAELEKEFNEVGRETARAFLPKSRVPSGESDATAAASGASVYSSEAHHSPSKISVPSRKHRNQQPSRINDITLATEISTSLLAQLKDLQAVLLDKDEALKASDLDRSQLEIEVEGLSQRLRSLDESESRLKDVNWNLETQVREFEIQAKAAADKEHRLEHNLNLVRTEKSSLEREFEELKQSHAKLSDEQSYRSKQHETELSGLRRNVSMGETERGALQRKVDDLTSQNQELAKTVAYRIRSEEQGSGEEVSPEEGADEGSTLTPEHSPPASPMKATPRHGQLESETLKHSLHHAHRMIQQLKNNIHREKTEKMELKRMLQDARDEVETNRNAMNVPPSASKRRKNDKEAFKKPARPDRLGALRSDSHEIIMDDEWEEEDEVLNTPSRKPKQVDALPGAFPSGSSSAAETSATEDFETANDNADTPFETADEREETLTETDIFQTGAETLDDNSDDLTETEAGPSTRTVRYQRSSQSIADRRNSYESTASTSGEEWDDRELHTPVQPKHVRYRLKPRQGYRRSTQGSQDLYPNTPPAAKGSPTSLVSHSNHSTPVQGQSLLAELGGFSGGESEDGSVTDGTSRRSSVLYPESSPEALRKHSVASLTPFPSLARSPLQTFQLPRRPMVDSGVMTEPWEPTPIIPETPVHHFERSSIWAQGTQPQAARTPSLHISSLATQDTTPQIAPVPVLGLTTLSAQGTEPQSAPRPSFQRSAVSSQDTAPRSLPPPSLHMSPFFAQGTEPRVPAPHVLNMSSVSSQGTMPQNPARPSFEVSSLSSQDTVPQSAHRPSFALSSHSTQGTAPLSPTTAQRVPSTWSLSAISGQTTEPKESHAANVLATAGLHTQMMEPVETTPREIPSQERPNPSPLGMTSLSSQATVPTVSQLPPLSMSGLSSQTIGPVEWPQPPTPQLSTLSTQTTSPVEPARPIQQLSTLSSQDTKPVEIPRPIPQLSSVYSQTTEPVELPRPAPPQFSSVSSQATEPINLPHPAAPQFSAVSQQQTLPVAPRRSPLAVSGVSVQHTAPVDPQVEPQPTHGLSNVTAIHDVQPESPTLPPFLPSPSRPATADRTPLPALAFSDITSRETEPSNPSRSADDGSAESMRVPLAAIASNSVQKEHGVNGGRSSPVEKPRTPMSDGGTQTMVSSNQIDRLLMARSQRYSGTIASADVEKAMSPPASPSRRNSNDRTTRRPGSSSSARSRGVDLPPLPADHRQVIAAASLKSPTISLPPPSSPGSMPPPTMPASAYKKRPMTPTIKTTAAAVTPTPKTVSPTPRLGRPHSQPRSDAASPITRQSSVSSFSSEIDQRFNIAGMASLNHSDLDDQVDPRMIQAITQTMFGEFMWKYTRKTGGGGAISGTRHRRYFWIHPFTRTLYWSKDGPTRGPHQMNAKSVAIESVYAVEDNNPLPPGLHEKSIVITTPGRMIQFTATTSQRHDTWMNALQYLLRKADGNNGDDETDEIQAEFNGGLRSSSRQTGRSRLSYATSYISHRATSPHHLQHPTLKQTTPNRSTSTDPAQGSQSGRLSTMFRPKSGMQGSFSSRFSKGSAPEAGSTYEEPNSTTNDLGHDLVAPLARGEALEMEDVRACCNGKHNLTTLPRDHDH